MTTTQKTQIRKHLWPLCALAGVLFGKVRSLVTPGSVQGRLGQARIGNIGLSFQDTNLLLVSFLALHQRLLWCAAFLSADVGMLPIR